jgi:hypothetical protein
MEAGSMARSSKEGDCAFGNDRRPHSESHTGAGLSPTGIPSTTSGSHARRRPSGDQDHEELRSCRRSGATRERQAQRSVRELSTATNWTKWITRTEERLAASIAAEAIFGFGEDGSRPAHAPQRASRPPLGDIDAEPQGHARARLGAGTITTNDRVAKARTPLQARASCSRLIEEGGP